MKEKKPRKKRPAFVVPTIKEVEDYILMKKPDWPLTFIEFYAAKFWNNYQSSGWKLSNGNSVKDWQACFNNNWQELKYNYILVLNEHKAKEAGKPKAPVVIEKRNGEFTIDFMNESLEVFKKHYDKITDETLASYYPWMKQYGYVILTDDEKKSIFEAYKDDKLKGMAACVRCSFTTMINYQKKFSKNGNS